MIGIKNRLILFCHLSVLISHAQAFSPPSTSTLFYSSKYYVTRELTTTSRAALFNFGGGESSSQIPNTINERDNQAINAVKAAIRKPRNPSMPLVECEFPALQALNKLGDGSLRSTQEAEEANLVFVSKLAKAIAPAPFLGPKVALFVSSSASNSFKAGAKSKVKGASIYSMKDDVSDIEDDTVCIVVMPSSRIDYQTAQNLAASGNYAAVIVVNGFAKDPKSVPGSATMAYYLKPLTYNSMVAGYLIRSYPAKWAIIDTVTKKVLASYSDEEILVKGTNTPDLRNSGRIIQKAVDERAIKERGSR